jgi:hypothetical protein
LNAGLFRFHGSITLSRNEMRLDGDELFSTLNQTLNVQRATSK